MRITNSPLLAPTYFFGLVSACFLLGWQPTAYAQTVVDLQILNSATSTGEIVISKGNDVLVGFEVTGESSKNDELQLIRLDGTVVSKIKRGISEIGNGSLHTNANNAIATLQVQYLQGGVVVATAPNQVTIVADEGSVVLSEQIADLQVVDNIQGGQISVNQNDIATNATNIATNTTNIGLVTAEVSTNITDIGILQGDVTTLQTDVAALQGGGGGLDGQTGTNVTALGVGALANNVQGNNTGIGVSALENNTGQNNTAVGHTSLRMNTTGNENVAVGVFSLHDNLTGGDNTAVGPNSLRFNTTGVRNSAFGSDALHGNISGYSNTATGFQAILENETGFQNTVSGREALRDNIDGDNNVAMGYQSLLDTTGNNNIGIGTQAGKNATTGNDNIYVGNQGAAGESGTIKIGNAGTQSRVFLAGIRGVSTGLFDAIDVVIDSNGQLGTVSSSQRFKEDIQDLGNLSNRLFQLRPVSFKYTRAQTDGSKPIQYGLVAEEVAQVFPDLVVYDKAGQVETVQYRKLIPLLLNEVQKEHRLNQSQEIQFRAQQEENRALVRRVADLTTQLIQENEALKVRLKQLEEQARTVPVSLH